MLTLYDENCSVVDLAMRVADNTGVVSAIFVSEHIAGDLELFRLDLPAICGCQWFTILQPFYGGNWVPCIIEIAFEELYRILYT